MEPKKKLTALEICDRCKKRDSLKHTWLKVSWLVSLGLNNIILSKQEDLS
jgi:hypothetical protein